MGNLRIPRSGCLLKNRRLFYLQQNVRYAIQLVMQQKFFLQILPNPILTPQFFLRDELLTGFIIVL